MIDWPTLGIMLLTYDRLSYAQMTIHHMLANLRYSGEIVWHLADDGSPDGYREKLLGLLPEGTTVTNSERGGYGASYNLASQVLHAKAGILLPLEDDWELTRPFNLDAFVKVLLGPEEGEEDRADYKSIGCIRMGYLGYTQPLAGFFTYRGGQHYLYLDPESKEPHVFAGHPRLETIEWQKDVGPWPEGERAGDTELIIASRSSARTGVVWPVDAIHPSGGLFAHIGAVQAGTEKIEVEEEEAVAEGIS